MCETGAVFREYLQPGKQLEHNRNESPHLNYTLTYPDAIRYATKRYYIGNISGFVSTVGSQIYD